MPHTEMTNDFSQPTSRRGTCSYKWDSAPEGVVPLWVADMDFATAPAVRRAVEKRAAHGIFGYTLVPDSYYEAVCRWFSQRHRWNINAADIIYTSGVVPAISAVIKALTLPADQVVVLTPVYNCFFSSIRNNGCEAAASPLLYDEAAKAYRIDFADLEQRLAGERARLLLLCNPHNPGGRVWTRAELEQVARLCLKHGVRVVSDEIHCELTLADNAYTPFGSLPGELSAGSITCCSPTKAFNIAGLQIANIVCRDAAVRERINRAININEVCDVNPFGVDALQAAYSPEGAAWLDGLRAYLTQNYDYTARFFRERLPQFPMMQMEGTYLAWIDCRVLGMAAETIEERLMQEHKVWVNAGSMYGAAGEGFIRINFACQQQRLADGLQRVEHGLKALLAEKGRQR